MTSAARADDEDGHPRVLVEDRRDGDEPPLDVGALRRLAARTLRAEGVERAELSIAFVDEDEIAALHERYLGEPGPTDVLSFALDADDVDEDGVRLLGDVVVAPAVALANNPDDPTAEIRLIVVHGVLHVLGYDHERDEERAEMWARQERYSGVRLP